MEAWENAGLINVPDEVRDKAIGYTQAIQAMYIVVATDK